MPRSSRPKVQLSDEDKKKRRREQKKMSMRRARAKMDAISIEERRKKDRERYHRKKQDGLLKTIKDFTPRHQRQLRKMWREKAKLRREKEKIRKRTMDILDENTPPTSTCASPASFSRIIVGKTIRQRNQRQLKAQNESLFKRLKLLERRLASYRMRLSRLKKNNIIEDKSTKISLKQKICNFFIDDENSRLTAGIKETITRKKNKKQIRLLNDTLLNLHKKFNCTTGSSISYETFRRYRPFWVIFPKAVSRNTCLCSVHTNIDFIVSVLHQAKITTYRTATELAKSICCTLNTRCLERKCEDCKRKLPNFNVINETDTIIYQRWVTKTFAVVIKGTEKLCKKTIKESVKTTRQRLVNILKSDLPKFMQHLANIVNQHKVIRSIKQNLTPAEGLLHIDFSENYCCKYESEIQSAHFGGSKSQLSLHTCVYYSIDYEASHNFVKTTSICSVSTNLRHDPVLICAHLTPVVEKIKQLSPHLKTLHILSDGPTTQYRNKTMFYMLVNYLSKIADVESIVWHFSEVGHGKGAPDGVGGCVKRICDTAVAHGRDVSNIDNFISCLKDNCKGIDIIQIEEAQIPKIQRIADASTCRPFKGTFQIHQLAWSSMDPNVLHVRRLSCISCVANINCPHFEIGQIRIAYISDSSDVSSEANSSASLQDILPSPSSSHRTESASTVSGLGTEHTPSPYVSEDGASQPPTPRKRIILDSYSSDESITPHKKPKVKSMFFALSDESDDENIF
ncbi:uncharacterized protein [Epargyreus clarus]|uniref:uncharacterized protein n=1 Tax=Epargyreus clarus TaxID=520877 RepID=UPI003C2F9E7E